jgi:hypothetical protein
MRIETRVLRNVFVPGSSRTAKAFALILNRSAGL